MCVCVQCLRILGTQRIELCCMPLRLTGHHYLTENVCCLCSYRTPISCNSIVRILNKKYRSRRKRPVCVCVWHCAALCSSVGLADCEYGRRTRHAGRSSVWNYRVNRRLLRMRETCRCPSAAYTRHQQRYYEHRFDA